MLVFQAVRVFRARNSLEGADVIVANHDLVLADLALGGGAVLPAPEDCIYILDEAHASGEDSEPLRQFGQNSEHPPMVR